MRKVCPNCFKIVSKGEQCSFCHYDFKLKKVVALKKDENVETENKISPNLEKLYQETQQVEEIKKVEKVEKTPVDMFHQKNGRLKWVSKRIREGNVKTPKKVAIPRVDGVHIDVTRSSIFGRTYSRYTPSVDRMVIENNGKYELEKLKWWEIYKWADRQLAKSKIKKQVNKEALKRPERISIWALLSLCLFSGFLGVHNFYAGNIKRGIVSAVSFSIAMIFVVFLDSIPFFNTYLQGLLCAIPGIICLAIWIMDFLRIIFRKFKYNTSRIEFIKSLDLETRARLGKKYIYIV